MPYRSRSRSRSPLPPRSRSRSPIRRRYSRSPVRYDRGERDYDHYESRSYRGRRYSRSRSPVRYDRSSYHRSSGSDRRRRGPYRASEEERARSTTLYMGNLPYQWREPEMRRWLEAVVGVNDLEIRGVSVPMEYDGRKNRGFAFVDFGARVDAEKVMAKHADGSLEADGRRVRCDWDVPLGDRRR